MLDILLILHISAALRDMNFAKKHFAPGRSLSLFFIPMFLSRPE